LAAKEYAFHAHDFVVHVDSYNQSEKLRNFYNILATDTAVSDEGKSDTFVVAVEAKHYPISGVMWHPET
jgi:anthranilate/para-aminobenzoate synthase component II